MAIDNETFGKRVRRLRLERGWTQPDLVARAGIDRVTLSQIETENTQNPTPRTVAQLAKAFGITSHELIYLTPLPDDAEAAAYPVWARGLPELPAKHVLYIRRMVESIAAEEAAIGQ